jgi:hypothetical protein
MGLRLPQECVTHNVRNLPLAMFLAWCHTNGVELPYPIEVFCTHNAPMIHEFFATHKSPTILQIRGLTQKLSVYSFPFSNIVMDLVMYVKPKLVQQFLDDAIEIETMYKKTEGYRKPLYIEYIIHRAIYGNNVFTME